MLRFHRHASGGCEARFGFQEHSAEDVAPSELRTFIRLGSSLATVNVWLTTLGAYTGYALVTGYEYAKALMYALKWLAQELISLTTHAEPCGYAFSVRLARYSCSAENCAYSPGKNWRTAPGYRTTSLAPSTRNLRAAALFTFYDWIIAEYVPAYTVQVVAHESGISNDLFCLVQQLNPRLQPHPVESVYEKEATRLQQQLTEARKEAHYPQKESGLAKLGVRRLQQENLQLQKQDFDLQHQTCRLEERLASCTCRNTGDQFPYRIG